MKVVFSKISAFVFLFIFFQNSLFAATGMEMTGEVSPDLTNDPYINLTVTVKKVKDAEIAGVEDSALLNRLGFILQGSSKLIESSEGAETDDANSNYYWDMANATVERTEEIDNNTLVFTVQILENPIDSATPFSDLIETENGATGINVEVKFYKTTEKTEVDDTFSDFIKQVFDVPNVAPVDFIAKGVYLGVDLKWTKSSVVAYTDGVNRVPSGVIALLFDADAGDVDLSSAAKISTRSADEDTAGSCTFSAPENSGDECIVCDDVNFTYLNFDGLKEIDGVKVEKLSNSGGISFLGLEEGKNYTAILQYVNGVKRTACYTVTPSMNMTPAEAYGEGKAGREDLRCFIATAAFGSALDPHVDLFRWFRDKVLYHLPGGKAAVNFYYEHSPYYAEYIKNHESVKTAVRWGLMIPAFGLYIAKYGVENPYMIIAFILTLFGFVFIRKLSF